MEWEKKDDVPVRLKYKVVLNGARPPKRFLRLVLDPAEGSIPVKVSNSFASAPTHLQPPPPLQSIF